MSLILNLNDLGPGPGKVQRLKIGLKSDLYSSPRLPGDLQCVALSYKRCAVSESFSLWYEH